MAPALGTASDKLGVGVWNPGDPQCLRSPSWFCHGPAPSSPTGSTPLTEPRSPVLCEPLTETCHRPAERRSQGLCPRVQKWFYEKFGEYVEDFRFQPEESAVETEEPLSARRWGPGGGLRAVGYSRTTQGPPVPGSQPCRREGPPWGGHAAVFPNPCGHAQACDRPHVGMVGTCPQARPG